MSAFADKLYHEIPKKYINPITEKDVDEGSRVNGKDFKMKKDAFRVKSLGIKKINTYKMRELKRLQEQQFKAHLKGLKQEKQDEKDRKTDELKKRKEAREEKERYEKIALKMHAKKVERLRKKEKRNKLLKER